MTTNMIGRMVGLAALLLLAAAIVAPAASAQGQPTLDFKVENVPTSAVQPIAQTITITLAGSYSLPAAPVQNLGGPVGTATATFDVQCPQDKILQSGSETQIITLEAGKTDAYEIDLPISLVVLREAPGLVPISCTVTGSVGAVGGGATPAIPESNTDSDSFVITPEYFSLLEATSSSKLRQGGPQKQIPFTIDLTNFGNAGTKVNFAILEDPGGRWQGLLPDPVLLDPPGGNQQTKQITFNVATPYKNGWNNDEGGFTIQMTPEYQFKTSDSQVGSPVTLTVLARVRGVYVPSLEPMVMVAAIIGTALVLRLQRNE